MEECIFCSKISKKLRIAESNHFYIVYDIDPIQEGHILIITKKHIMNLTELDTIQLLELSHIQQKIVAIYEKNALIAGTTFIQNNGDIMDDGVHFHLHVVPRYEDDDFWHNHLVENNPLSTEWLTKEIKSEFS